MAETQKSSQRKLEGMDGIIVAGILTAAIFGKVSSMMDHSTNAMRKTMTRETEKKIPVQKNSQAALRAVDALDR